MLVVTDNAVLAIRELVADSALSDHAGIRITTAADNGRGPFRVALAEAPAPGDQVLGEPEAPVYLSPEAARLLGDQRLDAELTDQGVRFDLRPQDAPET